jgi:hypothetical protein
VGEEDDAGCGYCELCGARLRGAPADAAPAWLEPGAMVWVAPHSSERGSERQAEVLAFFWPHLVFLVGWPGAVHGHRIRQYVPTG